MRLTRWTWILILQEKAKQSEFPGLEEVIIAFKSTVKGLVNPKGYMNELYECVCMCRYHIETLSLSTYLIHNPDKFFLPQRRISVK